MKPNSKLTPMMEQYFSIKNNYPDAILFYRLGDFYEMFYEDAILASKVLEITLTSRNKNAEDPIPMCGVPYHSAKDYIIKLIENGYKIAICEQMEDPKQSKGMVHREVVKIITPGTIIEDGPSINKENNYLVCLDKNEDTFYLVYIDITTGDIKLTQSMIYKQIVGEIKSIDPSEIIFSEHLLKEEVDFLKDNITSYYSKFSSRELDRDMLWKLEDAEPGEEQVLHLLFNYLLSVHIKSFDHIKPVKRYLLNQYLQINYYAKSQLELTRSLRTQKKQGSLLAFIDQTKTAMGGRLLNQWLDKPLIDINEIEKRHQLVEQLKSYYFERIDLISYFDKIYDIERLISKISMGSANGRDIDQLRNSLEQIPNINYILKSINEDYQSINKIEFDKLDDFEELLNYINRVLVDEPPTSITEGNIIKSGFNKELDNYRDALNNGQKWLAELQQRERERTGIKTLKIGYNKVFGYYIEMSRNQSRNFEDAAYTRKQTLANSERFITDELKEIETSIINAEEKSTALEYTLFIDLRNTISDYIQDLQTLANEISKLDVLCNFANLSEAEAFNRPILTEKRKEITLVDSRHPVVENLIGKSNFIPNDFIASQEQFFILLTGPNMSGKSTYMRQVAYSVILNQIGCFVPAKQARLPIFDKIFTRIGSADDITSGQSTFMVEMMETNIALEQATEDSLILFDEIGRGTATYDGLALADGIIKYIAEEIKALTVFSTHYHELTELDKTIPSLKNIHVGAKEHQGDLIFLHQVIDGPADKSYGIHVAKLAGLPEKVIEDSKFVLAELESKAKQLRLNSPGQEQLNLFEVAEPKHQEIIDELKSIDLNQMTPMDAFQFLNKLIEKLT